MAAVYKALSKHNGNVEEKSESKKTRQRVLILSSRGVTSRHRHLLNDLYSLLPHSRKESKLDTKTKLYQLNELADLYNCNNVLFFEARKAKDLYAWMSKPPNGPTCKFHVQNLHTMEELHFTGNCLKGSRPILSFDAAFDQHAHLRVIKELLLHVFGVPRSARKTKPFVDHVMGFTVAQGRIWIRVYQISEAEQARSSKQGDAMDVDVNDDDDDDALTTQNGQRKKAKKPKKPTDTDLSLVEIGPRFVLTPIIIMEGSFGGPIIYENKEFVSPNQIRHDLRRAKAGRHHVRGEAGRERAAKKGDLGLRTEGGRRRERDALDEKVLFA